MNLFQDDILICMMLKRDRIKITSIDLLVCMMANPCAKKEFNTPSSFSIN